MELARAASVTRILAAHNVHQRRAVSGAGRRFLEIFQLFQRNFGDRDRNLDTPSAAGNSDGIVSGLDGGVEAGIGNLAALRGVRPVERARLGVQFQMLVGGAGGELRGSPRGQLQRLDGLSGGVAHGNGIGRCDGLDDGTARFLLRGSRDRDLSAALGRRENLSVEGSGGRAQITGRLHGKISRVHASDFQADLASRQNHRVVRH